MSVTEAMKYSGLSRAEVNRRIDTGLWRTAKDGRITKIVRMSIERDINGAPGES